MKHKVSELDGALLDAAVAKAEGLEVSVKPGNPQNRAYLVQRASNGELVSANEAFLPSRDWAHGGPIIEREAMSVFPQRNNLFEPDHWAAVKHIYPKAEGEKLKYIEQKGPAPLIAAMRAYVASKLGEEVELP